MRFERFKRHTATIFSLSNALIAVRMRPSSADRPTCQCQIQLRHSQSSQCSWRCMIDRDDAEYIQPRPGPRNTALATDERNKADMCTLDNSIIIK